jgi:hypothetical protein
VKPAELDFDLPRLDAGAQPQLYEAVATLRSQGPDATELASLASRLALAGIDVTPPAAAPPRVPVRWKKWLAAGGAASGAFVWLFWSVKPAAPPSTAPDMASRALAVEARGQAPRGAVSAPLRASPARPMAGQEPNPPLPRVERAQPTTNDTRADEQAPAIAHDAVGASDERAPLRAPPMTSTTPSRTPTTSLPRAASPAHADTPELRDGPSEIELLRDARLALGQAPARALTLVEAHARAYPAGKLTQERELIAISALVALGRRTAALSRGARFQHDFPKSPYRDQVQQLLR